MKKIFFILTWAVLTMSAAAQQDMLMSVDTVRATFDRLVIGTSCEVRMVQDDSPVTTVTLIAPESMADQVEGVMVCNWDKHTLTIGPLPSGTSLEVRGPLAVDEIRIKTNAQLVADHYAGRNVDILLEKNATLKVRHLEALPVAKEDKLFGAMLMSISCMDYAEVYIDTLSGTDVTVERNKYDRFVVGANLLKGMLTFNDNHPHNDDPLLSGLKPDSRHPNYMLSDSAQHVVVKQWYNRQWYEMLYGGISYIDRTSFAPKNLDSPYLLNNTYAMKFFLVTTFNLGHQWGGQWKLRTGLTYSWEIANLAHQVEETPAGLVVTDGITPRKQQHLSNTVLGIPLMLTLDDEDMSIGVDMAFGRVLTSNLLSRTMDNHNTYWTEGDKEKSFVYNPWRIELGLNLSTTLIGIIHGVRLFTNLLPEYRGTTTGANIRSFGVEVFF